MTNFVDYVTKGNKGCRKIPSSATIYGPKKTASKIVVATN